MNGSSTRAQVLHIYTPIPDRFNRKRGKQLSRFLVSKFRGVYGVTPDAPLANKNEFVRKEPINFLMTVCLFDYPCFFYRCISRSISYFINYSNTLYEYETHSIDDWYVCCCRVSKGHLLLSRKE